MATGVEQGTGPVAQEPQWGLRPVAHRGRWILGGLALQVAGVGAPLAYVLTKAKKESVTGLLNLASVRLTWHSSLHTKAGLGLLIGGAVLFALGSVLLARPYVRRRITLLVAVPLAALAGVLVLGAIALLIALVFLQADIPTGSGGGWGGGKPKQKSEPGAGPGA